MVATISFIEPVANQQLEKHSALRSELTGTHYNFILKCFVLIDLKIGALTHQVIGQMDG